MKSKPFRTRLVVSAAGLLAFAAVLPAQADYRSTLLSHNPSAYWRLNETTPVPALDTATNRGTLGLSADGYYLNGITHPTTGIPGAGADTAATFPNPNNSGVMRVRVPFQPGLNPGVPFTAEFWANPSQQGTGTSPFNSIDFPNARGWLFYQDAIVGGQWSFRVYRTGGNNTISGGAVTANQWQHVVGVFDGTNVSLYVNGQKVAGPTAITGSYAPVTNPNIPLSIGTRADGASGWWAYMGVLDEVVFYTNVLSDADVLAHYNAGINPATGDYSALIVTNNPPGYWRLDEPTYNPGTLPVAANAGYLGTGAQGTYQPGVVTGTTGPGYSGLGGATVSTFNGFQGYVDCGLNVPDLSAPLSQLTVMVWAKFSNTRAMDWESIITCGDTAWELQRPNNDYAVNFRFAGSDVATPATRPINDGKWHHIAAVYDGAQQKIYLDGTLAASANKSGSNLGETAYPLLIGENGRYAGRIFNGNLAEMAVFTNALSAADVSAIYNSSWVAPSVLSAASAAPSNYVYEATAVTLNVTAAGTLPLSFQWNKNGSPLAGATSSSYLLTSSAIIADSGTYSVVVTNSSGSVTSSVVLTVVGSPPLILTQPASVLTFVGSPATFRVVDAGSAPRYYQWKQGTTALAGATNATLSLPSVQWADAGSYTCIISNSYGTTNTAAATLAIAGEFAGAALPETAYRDRHTALGSDGANLYFTRGNGGGAGFYRVPAGLPTTWSTLTSLPTPATWNGDAGIGDMAYYGGALWTLGRAGDATSARGVYYYNIGANSWTVAPFTTSDGPNYGIAVINMTNILGGWAGLGPSATLKRVTDWTNGILADVGDLGGSFAHPYDASVGPVNVYYIKHNYNAAEGPYGILASVSKTNNTITQIPGMPFNPGLGCAVEYLPGSFFADGHERLFVLRGGGTGGSADGSDWTSPVAADQLAIYDLTAQAWSLDTLPFAVDEGSEMALVNQTLYILSANGDPQPLKVLYMGPAVQPVITSRPVSQTIYLGQTAQFGVSVYGGGPCTFQWRHEGAAIPGATRNPLVVNNAGYGDAGSYDVVVNNPAGQATSQAATLTVLPLPTFAVLTNGLLLHLKFDGDFTDSSGNGLDGAAVGTPTFVSGKLGQAVELSTSSAGNNYVQVLDPNYQFQFEATNSFTIGLWLKYTNDFNDLPIIGNAKNSTYQQGYVLTEDHNQFEWTLVGTDTGSVIADPVGGPLLNDGAWHQLTVVFDRSNEVAQSFVDGAFINTRSISAVGSLNTGNILTIGQDPSGIYGVNGTFDVDDVGIWGRALAPTEAEAIYIVGQKGLSYDTVAPITLTVRQNGPGVVQLVWQAGTLQWSDDLANWTPVPGATAPYFNYTVTPQTVHKFFRVH